MSRASSVDGKDGLLLSEVETRRGKLARNCDVGATPKRS